MRVSRLVTACLFAVVALSAGRAYADNFTYWQARHDYRKCMYPMCGGYWVSRANKDNTLCADGTWRPECYVVDIDFDGLGLSDHQVSELSNVPGALLIRGDREDMEFPEIGATFDKLVATEVWRAASDAAPTGEFVRLTDSGFGCYTWPCPAVDEGRLNSFWTRWLDDVDLTNTGAADEQVDAAYNEIFASEAGVLAAGTHYYFWWFFVGFDATLFYLPVEPDPCQPSGCSGQICSDDMVVTTCEWREEYACIRQQICEPQADGGCGWTPTEASEACFEDLTVP